MAYGFFNWNYGGSLLAWSLRQAGHEAKNVSLNISAEKIQFSIDHLQIKDEIKDLEIQNLDVVVDLNLLKKENSVESFRVGKLFYRDLTRPNESLQKVLSTFSKSQKTSDRICLENLKIDSLAFAVSASAEPMRVEHLNGLHVCLDQDLSYEKLTLESKDLELQKDHIIFFAKPSQFWDIQETKKIIFSLKPFLKTNEVL